MSRSGFRPQRRQVVAGAAAFLALGGARAAAPATSAAPVPKRGGRVVMVAPEPNQLVNFATTSGPEQKVCPKMFEGLLVYDFNLEPTPSLAVSWSVSTDGLTYRFGLRPNVLWHDGKKFRAADVKLSIELLRAHHPVGRNTFAQVQRIDTPDDLTVVLQLAKPTPYLLNALAAYESPILPAHLYDGTDAMTNPANLQPVGTGPYRFKTWARGSYILFERNPLYWDAPRPYLDELVIRFIPDLAERGIAFENSELDLGGENPVPLHQISRLGRLPYIGIETRGYGYNASECLIEFSLEHPILRQLTVRQAIAHAIDREKVLEIVWYGYGVISASPISPNLKAFYTPDVDTHPFNPSLANALLDQAGYPRGSDGMRFTLRYDYNPYDANYARGALYIRQALRKVGINIVIRSTDMATFVRRVYSERDFDFEGNFLGQSFDPSVGVQRTYLSSNFKRGLPYSNAAGYRNAEVDALLNAAAVEPDKARRVELFHRFQQIVAHDLPTMDLVTVRFVTLFNRRVHDHTTDAAGLAGNQAAMFVTDPV